METPSLGSSCLSSPVVVKETLQSHGLLAKKQFGQNFLVDSNVLEKIVDAADLSTNDCVLEIGPGLGTLTQHLAKQAGKVLAVEIDKNLIPILQQNLQEYNNVDIVHADFLTCNWKERLANESSIKVVANLPYYITTPIVFALLESKLPISCIVVMMQKEVASRMEAQPSTKAYGSLSLAVQYYANVVPVVSVSRNCFLPRPEVDSLVVRLDLLHEKKMPVDNEEKLFAVIKAAFAMRRKTLINCLSAADSPFFSVTKEEAVAVLEKAGLHPQIRGEALSLAQFITLSQCLYES